MTNDEIATKYADKVAAVQAIEREMEELQSRKTVLEQELAEMRKTHSPVLVSPKPDDIQAFGQDPHRDVR